ncbi:unnamed protein product [Brachionus calyciflorus]|uniref:G-protein coupled receptors family 1 profile domain-containing protein n=1 Tax=Brachionus calyciflorus TaxID=104777 RepID=A0A814A2T2_9BILA|nr:unnamed protein product [Brachionus calyciflorus]
MIFEIFYLILNMSYTFQVNLNQKNEQLVFNSPNCVSIKKFVSISSNLDFIGDIEFHNYKKFSDLKSNCLNFEKNKIYRLKYYSESRLILNNYLDLGFCNRIKKSEMLHISFSNLKGIDFSLSIFNQLNYSLISIDFYFSNFIIYSNNKIFNLCTKEMFYSNDYSNILTNIKSLFFANINKFSISTCPLIFKDKTIQELTIFGLANSYFLKNTLGFVDLNLLEKNESLNTTISDVYLSMYKISLNSKLMNFDLFNNTNSFNFFGLIDTIDYKSFLGLNNLNFVTNNLENFVERNTYFFKYLNKFAKNLIFINLNLAYKYEDESFCLFKEFRSYTNLVFQQDFLISFKCKCTYIWIVGEKRGLKYCPNKAKTCNFELYLNNCIKNNINNKNSQPNNVFNSYYQSLQINFIVFIIIPIICSMGILTNSLSLIVLVKIRKESKETIYKIMQVNSLVVLVYCFLNLIHTIVSCNVPNGSMCLNISKIIAIQYFEMLIYDFVSSVLKSVASVLLIFLSYSRYVLLKYGSNTKLLDKKKKLRLYFLIVFFSMLNIEKIPNTFINRNFFPNSQFDYLGYPLRNTFKEWDYFAKNLYGINNFGSFNSYLLGFFIVNFIMNSFVFVLISFLADLMLLFEFRKNLNLVKEKYISTNRRNLNMEKIKKFEYSRLKITFSILVNLFVFLIFRTLEICAYSVAVYFKFKKSECISGAKFCSVYIDVANVFYFLSCSYNIVAYYFFNKKFASTLKMIIKSKDRPNGL